MLFAKESVMNRLQLLYANNASNRKYKQEQKSVEMRLSFTGSFDEKEKLSERGWGRLSKKCFKLVGFY